MSSACSINYALLPDGAFERRTSSSGKSEKVHESTRRIISSFFNDNPFLTKSYHHLRHRPIAHVRLLRHNQVSEMLNFFWKKWKWKWKIIITVDLFQIKQTYYKFNNFNLWMWMWCANWFAVAVVAWWKQEWHLVFYTWIKPLSFATSAQ